MGLLLPRLILVLLFPFFTLAQINQSIELSYSESALGRHYRVGYELEENSIRVQIGIGYLLSMKSEEKHRDDMYRLSWDSQSAWKHFTPFLKTKLSLVNFSSGSNINVGWSFQASKRINKSIPRDNPTLYLISEPILSLENDLFIGLSVTVSKRISFSIDGGVGILNVYEEYPIRRVDNFGNEYQIISDGNFTAFYFLNVGLTYRLKYE